MHLWKTRVQRPDSHFQSCCMYFRQQEAFLNRGTINFRSYSGWGLMGRNRVLLLAAVSLLVIGTLAWVGLPSAARGRAPRPMIGQAEKPSLTPVSAVSTGHDGTSPGLASTPSGFVYTVPSAQPLAIVVRKFWPQTQFMTKAEMETALRQANTLGKTGYLKAGQQLVIPGYEAETPVVKPVQVAPDFEVRAVYLTGTMAGSVSGLRIVQHWRQLGGNSIVFDVKDSDGSINIPFQHALAPHRSPAIPNLPKYVRWAHGLGLHVIARIALFRDENIAQHHSELAVHSRRTGQPWLENGKLVWTDSSNPQVQDYNIALAKTAAAAGVDEIQFDYVRFPAEGDQADAQFAFQKDPKATRADVIANFLQKAYGELHPMGVLVSLDVFGVMAWQRPVDLGHTGQDIVRMVRWCDVLSPMIYPSHFFGMDGYAQPGDAPEHFISESMERFQKITANVPSGGAAEVSRVAQLPSAVQSAEKKDAAPTVHPVVLRPWLQAFAWRTKTYSPEYIQVQVAASRAHGGVGFLFWNARNDYSKPMAAMPVMRSQPGRFFRGDELPGAPKPAVAASALPAATASAASGPSRLPQ